MSECVCHYITVFVLLFIYLCGIQFEFDIIFREWGHSLGCLIFKEPFDWLRLVYWLSSPANTHTYTHSSYQSIHQSSVTILPRRGANTNSSNMRSVTSRAHHLCVLPSNPPCVLLLTVLLLCFICPHSQRGAKPVIWLHALHIGLIIWKRWSQGRKSQHRAKGNNLSALA